MAEIPCISFCEIIDHMWVWRCMLPPFWRWYHAVRVFLWYCDCFPRRGQGSEMEALHHRSALIKVCRYHYRKLPWTAATWTQQVHSVCINMTWWGNLTTIKLEGLQDVFKTKIKGEISTRCSRFCKGRPAVALVHVLDTVLLYTIVNLLPCQRNHNLINTYEDIKGFASKIITCSVEPASFWLLCSPSIFTQYSVQTVIWIQYFCPSSFVHLAWTLLYTSSKTTEYYNTILTPLQQWVKDLLH